MSARVMSIVSGKVRHLYMQMQQHVRVCQSDEYSVWNGRAALASRPSGLEHARQVSSHRLGSCPSAEHKRHIQSIQTPSIWQSRSLPHFMSSLCNTDTDKLSGHPPTGCWLYLLPAETAEIGDWKDPSVCIIWPAISSAAGKHATNFTEPAWLASFILAPACCWFRDSQHLARMHCPTACKAARQMDC